MRELIFKLSGALILLASLAMGWLWMDYDNYLHSPMPVDEEGTTFTVPAGTPLQRITEELARQGLLTKPHYLNWHARQRGVAGRIHAGEYRIEPATTPAQLLDKMVRGEVIQYSLTLVEGWNFREVMAAVAASPHLVQTLEGLPGAEIMVRLGKPGEHPEGRFFPDTYRFPRGTTDLEFLRRAYRAMEVRLATAWDERAEGVPLKNPYEALILASIVEKETGLAEEREEIAGVFVRRLKVGMRLQTDPTVIYGMGERFDGNIRRRDLREDTPYNTYTRGGLPPTPIAMPGLDAIRAALNPADGKMLYFVSRGDGSHQFSATLEEHNRAVRKYQLKK